jgi:hypothetical protein
MQEFRIQNNGFNEVKKRLIVTMSIMFTTIFVIVILIPALMSDDSSRLNTMPYVLLLFLAICIFSITTGIKRQRPIFESFTLKIDDEKIVREKVNTPTLTIYHNEISKITKLANGGFVVQGKSKLNQLTIPPQIENHELLEAKLNQIKTITVLTSKTFVEKFFIPISLSGVVLVGITLLSKNDIVILISSILIVIILSLSLVLTQLSRNVDKRTKRLSWLVLIPLAVSLTDVLNKLLG